MREIHELKLSVLYVFAPNRRDIKAFNPATWAFTFKNMYQLETVNSIALLVFRTSTETNTTNNLTTQNIY